MSNMICFCIYHYLKQARRSIGGIKVLAATFLSDEVKDRDKQKEVVV